MTFYCNHGSISCRFRDIQCRKISLRWNPSQEPIKVGTHPCTTPFTVSGTLQRFVCISLSNYTTIPINLQIGASHMTHPHLARQNAYRSPSSERDFSASNSQLNAMECMLCILNQLYQSFTCKKTRNSKFSHTHNCSVYLGCCYDVTR